MIPAFLFNGRLLVVGGLLLLLLLWLLLLLLLLLVLRVDWASALPPLGAHICVTWVVVVTVRAGHHCEAER